MAHREDPRTQNGRGRPAETVMLEPSDGTVVVVLLGEHDLASRSHLRTRLVELVAKNALVVIDLSHVEFLDCSTLTTIVLAHGQALANGHRVVVELGQNIAVKRLLEIAGLLEHLTVASDRAEALSL